MLGLYNIYTSNDVEERTYFLRWIYHAIPKAPYLVCNDFSMFIFIGKACCLFELHKSRKMHGLLSKSKSSHTQVV